MSSTTTMTFDTSSSTSSSSSSSSLLPSELEQLLVVRSSSCTLFNKSKKTKDNSEIESKKNKDEMISLRAKLWDASRLARIILGRDCVDLKSTDILDAIRVVADMKKELKTLRKEMKSLESQLAKTNKEASSSSSPPVIATNTTHGDQQHDLDIIEASASDGFDVPSSCYPKDSDGGQDEIAMMELDVELMEYKVSAWQETFDKLEQAHERQIQDCLADAAKMYALLQQVDNDDDYDDKNPLSDGSHQKQQQKLTAIKVQIDHLVETVSSFPTKAKMQNLEVAASKIRDQVGEEEKWKRALDSALEENRNLREENGQLVVALAPLAKQRDQSCDSNGGKKKAKKKFASRVMTKLRKSVGGGCRKNVIVGVASNTTKIANKEKTAPKSIVMEEVLSPTTTQFSRNTSVDSVLGHLEGFNDNNMVVSPSTDSSENKEVLDRSLEHEVIFYDLDCSTDEIFKQLF